MPAFTAHYIFAKELMPELKSAADFEVDEQDVFIGAQGPDIFFFHRALPWQRGKTLRALGSAMHRTGCAEIADRLLQHCREHPSDGAKSYACGFLMHYALDRKCHPYIYFIQNRITQKFPKMNPHSAHNIAEHAIDSVLLRQRGFDRPAAFKAQLTLEFDDSELSDAANAAAAAAGGVKGFCVTAEDCKTAIRDTRAAQRLLCDKGGGKRRLLRAAERPFFPLTGNFMISAFLRTNDLEKAEKYVNINRAGWISPFGGGLRRESFGELFEAAKGDALQMIRRFLNGDSGEEITNSISFLTGEKADETDTELSD